ncbi:MAG: AAA family ATPase [Candidatus Omnitrophota bacterium]|nr:AAA family ATPase [Candidatus Omnitrophota bacterium]
MTPNHNNQNSILVVEGDEDTLFRGLQGIHEGLKIQKACYSDVQKALDQECSRVVICNSERCKAEARNILHTLSGRYPDSYWVLSSSGLATEEAVEYMRLGTRDFLKQPLDRADVDHFMKRVEQWNRQRQPGQPHDIHRIVSFFSSKGGVGSTMVAVNTAVALAKKGSGQVLLADFVLQHGNVAEMLDVIPQYTLLNLTKDLKRIDHKLLQNSLQAHSSGVSVLPCPKEPEEAELISDLVAANMLDVFKDAFQYTLLDVGHEMSATALACLDASDLVVLLTTPDLPSLSNTRAALKMFRKLEYPHEKVKLVLNRWHMKGEIDTDVLEQSLQYPVAHRLENDTQLALESANQGIPLAELNKNSKLVKSLEAFVSGLFRPHSTESPHGTH